MIQRLHPQLRRRNDDEDGEVARMKLQPDSKGCTEQNPDHRRHHLYIVT